MKCPVCQTSTFTKKVLNEQLKAKECSKCKGLWLSSTAYYRYLELHGETRENNSYSDISFTHTDSPGAKICPGCGHIMIKFKIGHGIDFQIDHCHSCNGLWLDQNEWEILVHRNLHDELNRIFTTAWQKQIRQEQLTGHLENIYEQKIGDDYKKVKEFKSFVANHPQKSLILAYLKDTR